MRKKECFLALCTMYSICAWPELLYAAVNQDAADDDIPINDA